MLAVLVADVVLSPAFAADMVPFQDLVVFDGKMQLLKKVLFELLEVSKFRKKRIYTVFDAVVIISCNSAMRRDTASSFACLRDLATSSKAGSSWRLDTIN